MSLLVDAAPMSVEIQGKEWPVNASFRTGILFEQAMLDSDIPAELKGPLALEQWFRAPRPPLCAESMEAVLWLYRCGHLPRPARRGARASGTKVFDYDQDDGYIFAAFLQQYGIDLEDVEGLHWWKFKALFDALDKNCMFCRIMEWRGTDLRKLKGAQKEHVLRMQRLYALLRPQVEQLKIDRIAAALMGDGMLRNL